MNEFEKHIKTNTPQLNIYQKSELKWIGKISNDIICEFEYFKDNNKIWINNINTEWKYKRQGFGTQMILAALKIYKEIYISTGTKRERNNKGLEGDLRYEADTKELMPFINKCVEKGILKKEWIQNPYQNRTM